MLMYHNYDKWKCTTGWSQTSQTVMAQPKYWGVQGHDHLQQLYAQILKLYGIVERLKICTSLRKNLTVAKEKISASLGSQHMIESHTLLKCH